MLKIKDNVDLRELEIHYKFRPKYNTDTGILENIFTYIEMNMEIWYMETIQKFIAIVKKYILIKNIHI